MQQLVIADIDAHMIDNAVPVRVGEDQVAGLQLRFGNIAATLGLLSRRTGQLDTMLAEYVLRERRAVECTR